MLTFEISEEEYNELKNRRMFLTNCEIQEGDRLYILNSCKLNKYHLDEYLENHYDDVLTTDIHNANIIIANQSNFNYTAEIGISYNDLLFRNDEQWKLYLSRMRYKPTKEEIQEQNKIKPLSESYEKQKIEDTVEYKQGKKIPYVRVYSDDLSVEMIKEYNNGKLKVIDESVLIKRIEGTIDNSKYDLTDIETLSILILSAKNKQDINAVIESVKKLHRETIITKILPYYYHESISNSLRNRLYEDIFTQMKIVKDYILEPSKAVYSNHRLCTDNIKKIQNKTKLKLDEKILTSCFLNE